MSNFTEKLTELMETKQTDATASIALCDFLLDRSTAIRDLVVAAESAHRTLVDEGFHAKALRLGNALAKLEES